MGAPYGRFSICPRKVQAYCTIVTISNCGRGEASVYRPEMDR